MPDDELVVNITERHHHPFLELSGVVDVSTVPVLRQALLDLTDAGETIIELDLRDVALIDSTGIGALAEAYRNGASLTLHNPSPTAMRELAMSGVDRIFTIK